MGNTPSKNLEEQRRELNGVTYFDRYRQKRAEI